MRFLAIVGHAVLAAVVYGVLHDQVTIRICPEYFTVAHPRIVRTESLTLLALFWGVFATWWVGLPLGVLLGIAARTGRQWPKMSPSEIVSRIGVLLGVIGVLAVIAGVAAYMVGLGGEFRTHAPDLASRIDEAKHDRFMAAWAMHVTSYFAGAAGGVVLAVVVLIQRRRRARAALAVAA